MKKALLTLIVCLMAGISAVAQSDGDKIIGTYKAVQDGNVSKVKISKNGDGYKAQIIWLEHPNNADANIDNNSNILSVLLIMICNTIYNIYGTYIETCSPYEVPYFVVA